MELIVEGLSFGRPKIITQSWRVESWGMLLGFGMLEFAEKEKEALSDMRDGGLLGDDRSIPPLLLTPPSFEKKLDPRS